MSSKITPVNKAAVDAGGGKTAGHLSRVRGGRKVAPVKGNTVSAEVRMQQAALAAKAKRRSRGVNSHDDVLYSASRARAIEVQNLVEGKESTDNMAHMFEKVRAPHSSNVIRVLDFPDFATGRPAQAESLYRTVDRVAKEKRAISFDEKELEADLEAKGISASEVEQNDNVLRERREVIQAGGNRFKPRRVAAGSIGHGRRGEVGYVAKLASKVKYCGKDQENPNAGNAPKTMDLACMEIEPDEMIAVCDALCHNSSVNTVDMYGQVVSHNEGALLGGMMKINKGIKNLNLHGGMLTLDAVKFMADGLRATNSITAIDMAGSFEPIDGEGADALANAIRRNKTLTSLNLNYNHLQDDGALQISEAIKSHPKLRILKLAGNEVGPEGALWLGIMLDGNPLLRVLDLSHNRLGTTGISSILAAGKNAGKKAQLSRQCNLEFVDLSFNFVEDVDSAASMGVARAVRLRRLNLSHNLIENIEVLGTALLSNQTVEFLDVSHNRIGDSALQARKKKSSWLYRLCGSHPKLRRIDMSDNCIKDSGARVAALAVLQQQETSNKKEKKRLKLHVQQELPRANVEPRLVIDLNHNEAGIELQRAMNYAEVNSTFLAKHWIKEWQRKERRKMMARWKAKALHRYMMATRFARGQYLKLKESRAAYVARYWWTKLTTGEPPEWFVAAQEAQQRRFEELQKLAELQKARKGKS